MRRENRLVISLADNDFNDWRSQEPGSSELSVHDASEVKEC